MARPRAFDPDAFLDQSLEVFWRQGFAATSMADIYAASGLGPGSVYAFVKDKTQLFQRVFERYGGMFAATLPADKDGMPAIEQWFTFLAGYFAEDPDRKGCLICNTIMERAAHAPDTLAMVDARLSEVKHWIADQLRRGRDRGEVPATIDPDRASDSLMATVFGMMALARAGADKKTLDGIVESALRPLRVGVDPTSNLHTPRVEA